MDWFHALLSFLQTEPSYFSFVQSDKGCSVTLSGFTFSFCSVRCKFLNKSERNSLHVCAFLYGNQTYSGVLWKLRFQTWPSVNGDMFPCCAVSVDGLYCLLKWACTTLGAPFTLNGHLSYCTQRWHFMNICKRMNVGYWQSRCWYFEYRPIIALAMKVNNWIGTGKCSSEGCHSLKWSCNALLRRRRTKYKMWNSWNY